MSTAVTEIRDHVVARLEELQPYLAEADQLRRILALLDRPGEAPAPADLPRSTDLPRPAELAASRGRAPQGANKRVILAHVLEHPGITAAEIARATGLKRTVVASTMSRLKRTGELEPAGDGARVPAERLADVARLAA